MALPQPPAAPGVVRHLRRCVLIERVQSSECNVNNTNYREARPETGPLNENVT